MTIANKFGVWAAGSAAAASLAYAIPQLLQVAGMLVDPWDRILIFAPSLALAPAYVLAIAAAYDSTPASLRIWSTGALGIAILYAADVSAVYIVQLGVVIPREREGEGAMVALAACCGRHLPATAIDLLGYAFMSVSTLLLAPAFPGGGVGRWLRLSLIANGRLGPAILLQLLWPDLIYVGALWLITFPLAMILLSWTFTYAPSESA